MSSIDPQLLFDIQTLRTQTQEFFDAQRLTVRQVIAVKTNLTTTRLLAYSYYGDSELGGDIGKLNDTLDISNIEGEIDIFTE